MANSVRTFLSKVGFKKDQRAWIMKRSSLAAVRSSYLIWSSRFDKSWTPVDLVSGLGEQSTDPKRDSSTIIEHDAEPMEAKGFLISSSSVVTHDGSARIIV